MFPTTSGSGLKVQPLSGDSLTQYYRSLTNQTGQTGAGAFNTGADTFGKGVSGVGTAQDTLGSAVSSLDPVAAYWKSILEGGPAATAAVAPYASMVGQQYAGAANASRSLLPQGGYSSTFQASLPFAQARDVGNNLLTLQPKAAQGIQDVATAKGALGGIQGNLAQILTQGGIGQEGVGSNMLQTVINAILQKMGINVTESGQNKNLASSLASTAGGTGASIYHTNVTGGG